MLHELRELALVVTCDDHLRATAILVDSNERPDGGRLEAFDAAQGRESGRETPLAQEAVCSSTRFVELTGCLQNSASKTAGLERLASDGPGRLKSWASHSPPKASYQS
jgi:hypothetical protein